MSRGLFVTGTDTGVGKTVVSAALLHRFGRDVPLSYWKPIQTGIEQDDDTATVGRLAGHAARLLDEGVRLPRPLSPHLAARLHGSLIDVASIVETFRRRAGQTWVVEGAGGVLVPVHERQLMVDVMAQLGLPALVVARSGLGTINHTLLTLEALRARAIAVAGVVMVGEVNRDNAEAIEAYGGVRVVAKLPILAPLDRDALAWWARSSFDAGGALLEWLR